MELVAYEDSVFEELMAESRFEGKDQSFLKQKKEGNKFHSPLKHSRLLR